VPSYIADCETDGLLPELTKLHSLVLQDIDTGHVFSCHDHGAEWTNPREGQGVTTLTIAEGVKLLQEADMVVFHNGVKFDGPAIAKVFSGFTVKKLRDTIIMTRLIWPEVKDGDFDRARKGKLPKNLIGSNSLKAWGYRLGIFKGEYDGGWAAWSPAMQTYCEQDVAVTAVLWQRCVAKNYSEAAVELEHDFAAVIFDMEQAGIDFDEAKAAALYAELCQKRLELERELQALFQPWFVRDGTAEKAHFVPKKDNKKMGYVEGCPLTKVKLREFNPGSRKQVGDRLMKVRGWKPTAFGKDGDPTIDDEVLAALPYPEAKKLAEFFLIEKRIGQLAEGNEAWMKYSKGGVIRGTLNTLGTVTRRGAHSKPNLGQVPSLKNADGVVPYGKECRELFHAPAGYVQVGADASGIQMRILSHYMARYDGGAYGELVVNGDVHTANKEAAGGYMETREQAKRFIYAFVLGCGDAKAGEIVGKGPKAGKALIKSFLERTPALKRLKEDMTKVIEKSGGLKAIDGGFLTIRSAHAALASLLQSGEQCVVKRATVQWRRILESRGYVHGRGQDFWLALHVHDEIQAIAKEAIAHEVGQVFVECIIEAGVHYNVRCPLNGEAKYGRNWAETH
jgi:DNA polymerase I-like protein with 3'-5' exonuclease and polymerase domains